MKYPLFVLACAFFISAASADDRILTCKEIVDAWVSHENGGMFSKAGPRGGHQDKPKNPLLLTFIYKGKTGLINGPNGQSSLVSIAPNTFTETAPNGNALMWTFIENADGKYLVKQNAVNLAGLSAFTVVFDCN